jgi:hypothetical protein
MNKMIVLTIMYREDVLLYIRIYPEAKSKVSDWGAIVDSGIGLPMVNVFVSTLEWT